VFAEKQNTYYGKYTFSVSVGVLHPSCSTVHAIHIHLGNPKSHISHPIYTFCIVKFHLIEQLMLWPACHKLFADMSTLILALNCSAFFFCLVVDYSLPHWFVCSDKDLDEMWYTKSYQTDFYLVSLLHVFLYEI